MNMVTNTILIFTTNHKEWIFIKNSALIYEQYFFQKIGSLESCENPNSEYPIVIFMNKETKSGAYSGLP